MLAMSFIDAVIPAFIGLVLVLAPRLLVRAKGDPQKEAALARKLRLLGGALLIIAVGYVLIMAVQTGFR